MNQIALKLDRQNADSTVTLAREVKERIGTNGDVFTNTPMTMADLNNLISDVQTAQQATLTGGKDATILRNEKLKALREALKLLAHYVLTVSNGNVEIILLAGMPLKRTGARHNFIATPINLRTRSTGSGEAKLLWKKVPNAKGYEVEYCLNPIAADAWVKSASVSSAKTIVGGLEHGKDYWFRVRAIGAQGLVSDWSDPALQLVA